MAGNNLSRHQIQAVMGHKTMADVTQNTLDANRADLADGAVKGMNKKTS
jgi:hypothetical protein